jgi:hypothetical protein
MKQNTLIGLVLLGAVAGVFIYMRKKPSAISVPRQPTPIEQALTKSLTELKAMTAPGAIFHNPLNIRHTANSAKNPWKGQTGFWDGKHGKFVKFEADEYGFRAAAYLLRKYAKEGITTVNAIINKWAPPNENETSKYVAFVTKQLKLLTPHTPIASTQWPLLLQAMAKMETGKTYPVEVIKKGIALL